MGREARAKALRLSRRLVSVDVLCLRPLVPARSTFKYTTRIALRKSSSWQKSFLTKVTKHHLASSPVLYSAQYSVLFHNGAVFLLGVLINSLFIIATITQHPIVSLVVALGTPMLAWYTELLDPTINFILPVIGRARP